MNLRSMLVPFALSLFALTSLFGCQAPNDPTDEDAAEDVAAGDEPESEANLYRVNIKGGSGSSYSCGGGVCTCYGDDDCNDMFSSGVCGGAGLCHDDAKGTWCECVSGGSIY